MVSRIYSDPQTVVISDNCHENVYFYCDTMSIQYLHSSFYRLFSCCVSDNNGKDNLEKARNS